MKRLQMIVAVLLMVLVASPALAEDKAKKEKKAKQAPMPGVAVAMGVLRGVKLTDEQKEKVTKIGESFNEKIVAINTKLAAVEPAEAKKARQEAMAKAKAEGKQGKDLRDALKAAGGEFSKEQKEAMKAVQEERKAAMKEMKDALLAVLNDDQRAALSTPAPEKKKKDK